MDAPTDVKSAISRLQSECKQRLSGASWTRPDGFHITPKFLGEISEQQVDAVKTALAEPPAQTRFKAEFDHTGTFPKIEKARVLWAGLGKGAREMRNLFNEIEGRLSECGFPRENRPFSAHLTLARFRNPRPVPPEIIKKEVLSPVFLVDKITFFQSRLDPKGAIYTPIALYNLLEN